jgi:hypothetical protein
MNVKTTIVTTLAVAMGLASVPEPASMAAPGPLAGAASPVPVLD